MLTYNLGSLLQELDIEYSNTEKVTEPKKKSKKKYIGIRNINTEDIIAKLDETEEGVRFTRSFLSLEMFQKISNTYIYEESYYGKDFAFYFELKINDVSKLFSSSNDAINIEGTDDNFALNIFSNRRDTKTGLYVIKQNVGVINYLCKIRTKKSNLPIENTYLKNKKEEFYPTKRNVIMPSQVPYGIMHPYQGGQFVPK